VCAARGFDAARMEEIAARAAVSKGTLYNFFESKDALVIAAVAHTYEAHPMLTREGSLAPGASPRQRLEALLAELRAPFERVSAFLPVGFQGWALAVRDPARREQLASTLRESYARNNELLVRVLQEAKDAGELSVQTDATSVATALIAIFDGLLYRSVFDAAGANPELLRAAHDGLVQALFAPRGDENG